MVGLDAASLVAQIRSLDLVSAQRLGEIERTLLPQFSDARSLVGELLHRDWLTPYQANQLLTGNGAELVLGPYQILERIGSGGMGQVYKARHTKMGRLVALKVISRDKLSNNVAVERFYREAQAASQLNHPNIVAAYDAGSVGGQHYFAMEFVEGTDLARLLRERGPLPIAEACEYVRQAALGLQAAADKGVIHRDIKPSNLLVSGQRQAVNSGRPDSPSAVQPGSPTPDGHSSAPVVKILDFGLARFESETTARSNLTQVGRIVGTVDFMSPEQAEDPRKVDIRSDIYSLGCTLFYLLTGKPPFSGSDLVAKLMARLTQEPISIRTLRPDASTPLEQVLAKLLARDPQLRWQTPGEVARALESVIALHGGSPASPPPREKAQAGGATGSEPLSLPGDSPPPPATTSPDNPFASTEGDAPPLLTFGVMRRRSGAERSALAGRLSGKGKLWLIGSGGMLLAAAVGIGVYLTWNQPGKPEGQVSRYPSYPTTAPVSTDPTVPASPPAATTAPIVLPPRSLPFKERGTIRLGPDGIRDIAVDESRDQVILVHDKVLRAWSLRDGTSKGECKADPMDDDFKAVFLIADGKTAVSVTANGTIRRHDPADLKETGKVEDKVAVLAAAVSPDSTTLALGAKGAVLLVNLANFAKNTLSLQNSEAEVVGVAYSTDGKTLIAVLATGDGVRYELATKAILSTFKPPKEATSLKALAPDGEFAAYVGPTVQGIVIWDPVTQSELARIDAAAPASARVHFATGPAARLVAVYSLGKTRLHAFENKQLLHEEPGTLLGLSPDARFLMLQQDTNLRVLEQPSPEPRP